MHRVDVQLEVVRAAEHLPTDGTHRLPLVAAHVQGHRDSVGKRLRAVRTRVAATALHVSRDRAGRGGEGQQLVPGHGL